MRKPAKKYFSPSLKTKAIMQIRQWLDSGATPLEISRWIFKEYSKTDDERTREHLGLMLCAAMDAADGNSARRLAAKCARMFDLPKVKGRTLGEIAMLSMAVVNLSFDLKWNEDFNPTFAKYCPLPPLSSPKATVSKSMADLDHSNIVTIDSRNKVYFMRDLDANNWLIVVNDCNNDMLIDEEAYFGEAPLYFTDSTHFVSPVWIVNQVAAVLEHILMRIGYPPFHIFKRVIFEAPNANLINEEEYTSCPHWKGVDVVTLRKTDRRLFSAPTIPIVDFDGNTKSKGFEMDSMLYLSVMATAKVLEDFSLKKIEKVTKTLIKDLCKKNCIFTPDHFDFDHDEFDDEEP